MTKIVVFNTLGYEDAIDQSFMEANEQAEAEAEERKLKELKELIEKSHQERGNENDQ